MKLGVHIGYWGLGLTSEDQLEIVQEAERLGYDSVWAAEAYGSDTATILGWLAGQTSTIRLGSGIFQMPGRSAAMTAMTAATIDQISNGRMILGIGSSGPQVSEGWHGVRFGKQLARTRDYVAVLRMALARERLNARTSAARRAGQSTEVDDWNRSGSDSDLHRRDRTKEHAADR
jgi:alkanesulfonate monooxygenase SsuD/methylene tetrahydromethanopterin reductase-like flavin-dependent oxidoreductase (luciferase family)